MKALLRVDNLHVNYGRVRALKGVSFNIESGELVSLIGANGAGKSTTLKAVFGMLPIVEGSVQFEGERISGLSPPAVAKRGIAYVPEGRQLFPQLTVLENLELAYWAGSRRKPMEKILTEVYDVFPRLRERRQQLAGTLSGGEQQMVAIGRGLMSTPQLLMLDEPSLGLAPVLVQRVAEVIRQLNEAGLTVLLVEQNAAMALNISHRAYVFVTGRVVLSGSSQELLQDEGVQKAYLGVS